MEGFDYIIKRLPPARICFGSSIPRTICRRTTKEPPPTDRQIELLDASDDNPPCHCPAVSPLGFGPLASQTPRFLCAKPPPKPHPSTARRTHPLPTTSAIEMRPRPVRRCWPPFGRTMHEREIGSLTPGPGTYNTQTKRTVRIIASFGGRRRFAAAVHTVCAPTFLATCAVCRKRPSGLYWLERRKARSMCRHCMADLRRQLFFDRTRGARQLLELEGYVPARYCNYMHEHCNTTARVQVIGQRELVALYRRENYLSMFRL